MRPRAMRPRCVAPVDCGSHLCGLPATEERVIEGVVCPLCAEHAAEIDRDVKEDLDTCDETN